MPLKRDQSRALQIGFLVLLTIASAQVTWWITENVYYSDYVANRFEAIYRNSADALNTRVTDPLASDRNALLRDLRLDPASNRYEVDPRTIETLRSEAGSRIKRYYWEGGFFLVVLIGGMSVLTATIRHDFEMRRRQQNFLAGISHEFKSPLTSIRLAAETLKRRSDSDETRRYVPRILADTERLLGTVNNLLDTVRLEEGRHRFEPRLVPLEAAAATIAGDMWHRAETHGIEIATSLPENLSVYCDPTALDTILRNLIDNAIKACVAGDGKRVEISARHVDGLIELAVTDDGMGFPPDDSRLLFEKFYRVGDEMQRSTTGTGLGLYIVKQLAQRCGATVSARSDGPGLGATVSIIWNETESA